MNELNEMMEIVGDRGSSLNRDDLTRLKMLSVDVPLEESEKLGFLWESVALIVNDPLYQGDIEAFS